MLGFYWTCLSRSIIGLLHNFEDFDNSSNLEPWALINLGPSYRFCHDFAYSLRFHALYEKPLQRFQSLHTKYKTRL